MGYDLVASTIGRSTNGGNSFTSDPIDTTGANLLVVVFATYAASAGITDSKGNTWNTLTFQNSYGGTCQIFWCVPTSVGSGHTISSVDTFKYPAAAFYAFSGAHASPFEAESGADYGTSSSPGSLTPSEPGSLIISGAGANGAYTPSATGGFTTAGSDYLGGNAMALGAGYLIQGTAAAVNPSWTWGTGSTEATAMAVFKPAAVPLAAGTAEFLASGPNGGSPYIEVQASAPTAGSGAGPTYQWERSTNGGAYSDLSGATSLTLTDSTATAGNLYSYRLKQTRGSETVTTNAITAQVYPGGAMGGIRRSSFNGGI